MDVATDVIQSIPQAEPENLLSYDDSVAYEQQVPTTTEEDPRSNLASRIGNTKIYLLSEATAAAHSAKRKYGDDSEEIVFERTKRVKESTEDDEVEMEEDLSYRGNAILLQGTPISHLPTARLFAYAKHFDTSPLGLEWVNDQTCIFVFESNSLARTAFSHLQKSTLEDPDADDFVTVKPIPVAIWPPETRINQTLGVGEGLKGVLKMRWARFNDVKKRGAKRESQFYRKHGRMLGRSFSMNVEDQESERKRLDAELDNFLREPDEEEEKISEVEQDDQTPSSPPSKMRSDYIANDGRTLLDRFSDPTLLESNPADRLELKDRLTVPLPRRARGRGGSQRHKADAEGEWESNSSPLWDRLSTLDVDSNGGRRGGLRRGGSRRDADDSRYGRSAGPLRREGYSSLSLS
ncbi:hypothetical protein Agabi119p4_5190 [Agaricus bisporus var. burnettii]|uniref:Uncharacterized protein n=1 Tax=Agaricus bisporus var. burnettii TaxID=192524 RepID=A0A8H7F4P2_AGABI|nr:hypothetical protein Agabi119p4_5190 [Agaricus bisporus var. burnettii]